MIFETYSPVFFPSHTDDRTAIQVCLVNNCNRTSAPTIYVVPLVHRTKRFCHNVKDGSENGYPHIRPAIRGHPSGAMRLLSTAADAGNMQTIYGRNA